jgi:hypothetical protein
MAQLAKELTRKRRMYLAACEQDSPIRDTSAGFRCSFAVLTTVLMLIASVAFSEEPNQRFIDASVVLVDDSGRDSTTADAAEYQLSESLGYVGETQAIGGTRLRAIGGTRLRAIGGTRLRSDDTSDSQAIGGTRLRAIGGTRLRAIGGTRLRAAGEGEVQAIGGTRLRAIGGTRLRAIGGTRLRAADEGEVQAIGGTRLRAIGGTRLRGEADESSIVLGPVSAIDAVSGTATVLDRTIQLLDAGAAQQLPGIGEIAAVVDCVDNPSKSVLFSYGDYFVPGVTQVLISGVVEDSDESTASFTVNGYTISYARLLVDAPSGLDIPVGSRVTVKGELY